ncbi:GIY-YIG nuclease family protein [Rhodococcus sp. T2V]|uniref:GIY-YIG nuclease family protein n=1 Tax=Rhodococcus sp. T2V TaxID=3034164 RepID=UPI0023E0FC6C|nr:GIY-YIG nuclease family protein [Rhodococcus sp. T2V]MDF3310029.1 GIY-YIG nuclease family protein [Rhodococcus sp. T2V]
MSAGKSVRLFLADGTPGGLLTAEIMNWTGHVVAAPRSDLAELLKRPETSRTGIYILVGEDPASVGGLIAYIGEGDDVSRRLYHHARPGDQGGKDFWDRAIVLTSKDANLTKAHARYLESRFIALALQASRATLTNATTPPPLALPEADVSDMEYYIAQAKIVLPVLGINIFRSAPSVDAGSPGLFDLDSRRQMSPVFELHLKKEGLLAKAREIDGEFTVLAGSQTRTQWTATQHEGYRRLREKLLQDGTIAMSDDGIMMHFTRAQVFGSPSAAGAVILGRAVNGRTDWRIPDSNMNYGSWQNQGVETTAFSTADADENAVG